MKRLKHMPEGTLGEMLGSGMPDEGYHEGRRKFEAAAFVGGVVVGFYYGVTHLEQAQQALQSAYYTVEDWLLSH